MFAEIVSNGSKGSKRIQKSGTNGKNLEMEEITAAAMAALPVEFREFGIFIHIEKTLLI